MEQNEEKPFWICIRCNAGMVGETSHRVWTAEILISQYMLLLIKTPLVMTIGVF
jgi:hypothetical protein